MGGTRSRKNPKGQKETRQAEVPVDTQDVHDDAPDSPEGTNASSVSANLLWGSVFVLLVAGLYLNPGPFLRFIDQWIGFSENNGQAPVARHTQSVTWLPANEERKDAVVSAFKHAWHAYERDAMGYDEYHPLSRQGSNLSPSGGIGYMIVDTLDTLRIMGLEDEYARARSWVQDNLTFDREGGFSTFETTIRVLGGLLSAYHLSGNDPVYLEKAEDLGNRLLSTFQNSPYGLPYPVVNLKERKGSFDSEYTGLVSVAEVGTLQLEFKYLSHLTGNEAYWEAVEGVMNRLRLLKLPHGLASVFLSHEDGQYITSAVSLGSRGDSFYEYLLKQFIQTNRTEAVYEEHYREAMDGAHEYLIKQSPGNNLVYTSELTPEENAEGEISWRLTPKQDHLVCFLGGSLMLGAINARALVHPVSRPPRQEELTKEGWRDWKTGLELIKTCVKTHDTATGLSPEIVYFRVASDGMDEFEYAPPDWYIRGAQRGLPPPYDARYILRPETVESLFIAYRLTGEELYREHGWSIFQAIMKHCRVESGGFATILNVDENPARLEDKMETFFLSETLKYLYLLFSDSSILPLDEYVFNTEAHPFPILSGRRQWA